MPGTVDGGSRRQKSRVRVQLLAGGPETGDRKVIKLLIRTPPLVMIILWGHQLRVCGIEIGLADVSFMQDSDLQATGICPGYRVLLVFHGVGFSVESLSSTVLLL